MLLKDKFNNKDIAQSLARQIAELTKDFDMSIMEVCGTHTMAIHRFGIKSLLPGNIKLLSGPGCPVCVTPNEYIDKAIAYSTHPDCILATFGDMNRVPGSYSSLAQEKAKGANIKYLYSPRDSIEISQANPDKKVIFFAAGFETTAPTIAATIKEAHSLKTGNLFVISALKTIPETLQALVNTSELNINGFLLPGHLSTITGTDLYNFLPIKHKLSCVVSGFEPTDILQSVYMLVRQITKNKPSVENQYSRIVRKEGNIKAQTLINEVFCTVESNWRGIGKIPGSGLKIRQEFQKYDAEHNIPIKIKEIRENQGCICGLILRGLKTPPECPLYKKTCTPETPSGACMVSSEGTCAAYYKYVQ